MLSVGRTIRATALALPFAMVSIGFAQTTEPAAPRTKGEWARKARVAINSPYPDLARFDTISGNPTARVAITVRRDGTVETVELRRSSSIPLIDEAALGMARGADDIPPFTSDMPDERVTLLAPFAFKLDEPERRARLFVDDKTGLRLELPAPLLAIRPRRDETGAVLIDLSADGLKSDANPDEPARFCNLTMEPWPAGETHDQAALNDPAAVNIRAQLDEEVLRDSGYVPSARTVAMHDGAALVTVEGRGAADGPNRDWITWNMTADRSEGRIGLLCMAAKEEEDSARNIIRRVLDGISVVPR